MVPAEARRRRSCAASSRVPRILEIDGERDFAYESVYFDTPDLTSYLGAAHRRRRRFKIRTRTYVDSALCWVEVKTRGPRGSTVKTRLPYDPDDRDTLTDEGRRFADDVLDSERGLLPSPTLVSTYRRTTLFLPRTPTSRTTIDTDLVWTSALTGESRRAAGPRGRRDQDGLDAVLHRPAAVAARPPPGPHLQVRHRHGRPAPDLPHHPWRRVLDRHVTRVRSTPMRRLTPKILVPAALVAALLAGCTATADAAVARRSRARQ